MFGKGRRKIEEAWARLPPDDPFVKQFAQPNEIVWNGVNAIDWTLPNKPGVPREACESLLVLTNQRLLIMHPTPSGEPGIMDLPLTSMAPAYAKKMGAQGILTLSVLNEAGGVRTREYSMPRAMAPLFAERLNSYLA